MSSDLFVMEMSFMSELVVSGAASLQHFVTEKFGIGFIFVIKERV